MRRTAPIFLGLALAAGALAAADPFYLNLLAEGGLAAERGDTAEAARKLRIACFGFLEEPALLAECQARLAVVHAARGDRPAFQGAVDRILELERRFGAYGHAALPEPIRLAFEERALSWIPVGTLGDVPVFAAALRRQRVARLASLPPTERQHELEALAGTEPTNSEWPLELARLAAAERNVLLASEWLDRAQALAPDDVAARCLRGQVSAMARACAAAVADLAACPGPPAGLREAAEQLTCWVASGDLEAAAAFAAALPPDVADARPVRKLSRELAQARELRLRSTPQVVASGPAGTVLEIAGEEAQPAPAAEATPTPLPEQQLRDLRGALRRSRDYAAVNRVCDQLIGLADLHPGWVDAHRAAGEAAYRASRWTEAVRLLGQGELQSGAPPPLLFYYAVALYESGRSVEAAAALQLALPGLEHTPLVEAYSQRILSPSG